MKTKKNVISILGFSFLFLNFSFVYAENRRIELEIQPKQIFVEEDSSILFTARFTPLSDQGVAKPEKLTLIEWNDEGTDIKYHWELSDDGKQGDEKAGDGVFSRVIQFKEKKIKALSFWVTDEKLAENTNPTSVFLHKTPPQLKNKNDIPENQKVHLTIVARPTFQGILKDAYQKVKNKFEK